ncbi:MAG: hypothetical protein ACRBDI_05045 [Alphaproteobacteria bacterium]
MIIKNEQGNALFFILLAVALLGFLTALMSRGTSSTNQTGDIERARITASSLLQYTKSIETTVQNMVLGGISENDLDFIAIGGAYDNPNCTETTCEVFNVDGGGIPYRPASRVLNDKNFANNWIISTGNRIGGMGCDTASHACRDLIILLSGISDAMCLQINKIMDIENPSNNPPQQQYVEEGTIFTGSFSVNTNNRILGGSNTTNESPQIAYKSAGCVTKFDGTSTNYFFQVLAAR